MTRILPRVVIANNKLQAGQLAWRRTIRAWVYIPVGVLCVLLACWGADSLIGLSPVSFPASVALLIVLFFALILSESLLGDKKTKAIVRVIDIPVCLHTFDRYDMDSRYARQDSLCGISMSSFYHLLVSDVVHSWLSMSDVCAYIDSSLATQSLREWC